MSAGHRDTALKLAANGWPVMPLNADKSPRVAGGFKSATTDPAAIEALDWNGGGMIGVAIPDGMVVVDIDPRHGGDKTWAAITEGRQLPRTRTVKTRGGGLHFYFQVPEGDVLLRSSLGPGIDLKKAGKGYVVVPPSEGYSFVTPGNAAPVPEWLYEEMVQAATERTSGEASAAKYDGRFMHGTTYGEAALGNELGALAQARPGDRNNALNRAAYSLGQLVAGGELAEEYVVEELGRVAELIGLEHREIVATVGSAMRSGMQAPRQAPELKAEAKPLDTRDTGTPGPAEESQSEREARMWVDWNIEEPPPPFYLHPILPRNAYVLVYGSTEASKSMTFNGLLAEASTLGFRCSVYSLENPPHTDRDRLRRMRPDPANFRLTNEPLDLADPGQLAALIRREKDWGDGQGSDIILLDTYSHAFGWKSDDGNAKAIEFARRIRHVMHEVGCTVVVVDHTGYANATEPRDASAKRQQVDVAILMEKKGEWALGQPSRWTMANKKAARFANPFYFHGEIRDTEDAEHGAGLAIAFTSGERPEWRPGP